MNDVAAARSLLFVPGHRPDRFEKARDSGADGIILDLEDAVGPDRKDEAREHVRHWLAGGGPGIVRVNAAGTPWHDADLDAVTAAAAIMIPKATPDSVAAVARAGQAVVALVETAAGVLDAAATARHPSVVRLAFGNVDLGAELGVDPCDQLALLGPRTMVVLASAAAGVAAPLDGVTTSVRDDRVLRADTAAARTIGFTGKLCIHPGQIAPVHGTFAPTAAEIADAERVIGSATGDVGMLDGRMIDAPVVEHARTVLRRARTG